MSTNRALKAFGFRVHTHELGRRVTLERMIGGLTEQDEDKDTIKCVLLFRTRPAVATRV